MAPRGRGRGRGGGRGGRGGNQGRGRGGRAGRGGGRRGPGRQSSDEPTVMEWEAESGNWRTLFLSPADFAVHVKAQEADKFTYLAAFILLRRSGIDVPQANRVRALAAAWARRDLELAELLLSGGEWSGDFGVTEVVKALALLDSGRALRAVEKKAAALKEAAKTAGPKGKSRLGLRLVQLKKDVHNLGKAKPPFGSLSGALSRQIRKWTRGLSADALEFYALHLPRGTWTELADKTHLHPERDFPALPWFLRYCYDPHTDAVPADTLVAKCRDMGPSTVNDIIANVDVPYAHVKKHADALNEASKVRIATYTADLDTVIWYYEDLACPGVDSVICRRLDNGETVNLPYGKLMERLLHFRKLRGDDEKSEKAPFFHRLLPAAEERRLSFQVDLESPVVVIGDASASMDVAIQTSTIIASFLRALTDAQLIFFSRDAFPPLFVPKTVAEVLELAVKTKTVSNTCHASALLPFYSKKEVVKTFILTTDEEENADVEYEGQRYRFQTLFAKYHAEVYPARLVFVSFLRHQHGPSQMVDALRDAGYDVLQFKLDGNRPDLTKLDNLVGHLSLGGSGSEPESEESGLGELATHLRLNGLNSVFQKLTTAL